MSKFLIIQTAFIGDVVLATSVVEKIHLHFPKAKIDFMLRRGNESLFKNHPFLDDVLIWDKRKNKYGNLFKLIQKIRKEKYDYVINLQRFTATGIVTALSAGKTKIGFDKNPLSFLFTTVISHDLKTGKHEIQRNLELIKNLTNSSIVKPKLYPSSEDEAKVTLLTKSDYVCIAPTSVWFTKQFPATKWKELINQLNSNLNVYLIGGPDDYEACEAIKKLVANSDKIKNLAGHLTFLESAALMEKAKMNYVNDSAPMHIASAMNAPTTAIFCSTLPQFGFGPLSEQSTIIETQQQLNCRPCGLHGKKECPENHFKCAYSIDIKQFNSIN